MVLGLEIVCSPSCLRHCLSSRVSLSGTGMQLFLQQSLVPHAQPQLPQTIFSMPGILGKRAKSRFLAPCSTCWSALHPSLSPGLCSHFLVCLPAQPQVSQAGGLSCRCPHTSYFAQNVQCPSGHKDLDFARGARSLETSVVIWERGTELSILGCREMLGTSPRPVAGGTAAARLLCTGIAGEKAGTSTNDLFPWAALSGCG